MRRLFAVSIFARLPLAMLTIGVLVHVKALTGSFAAAGVTSGALAVAQGVGGPLLGRVADRRGQTAVLVVSALGAGGALAALAAAPADAPLAVLLLLAAALGALTPPVPACFRALLPDLIGDPDALRRAYAADSAAVELTWIAGPPLVLALGTVTSTGGALVATGTMITLLTLLFATAPASLDANVANDAERHAGGALRSPGVRTLAVVLAGAGFVFGGTEVGAAAASDAFDRAAATGLLLGLWGIGGLLGGLVAARAGGGARSGAGLAALLAALGVAHAALAATAVSLVALAPAILLAGAFIAPTCATAYAMVDTAAPHGTATEAFALMATAVAIGTSLGAALAGAVADAGGPAPTFLVAGAPAVLLALLAATRAETLTPAIEPLPGVAARPATV